MTDLERLNALELEQMRWRDPTLTAKLMKGKRTREAKARRTAIDVAPEKEGGNITARIKQQKKKDLAMLGAQRTAFKYFSQREQELRDIDARLTETLTEKERVDILALRKEAQDARDSLAQILLTRHRVRIRARLLAMRTKLTFLTAQYENATDAKSSASMKRKIDNLQRDIARVEEAENVDFDDLIKEMAQQQEAVERGVPVAEVKGEDDSEQSSDDEDDDSSVSSSSSSGGSSSDDSASTVSGDSDSSSSTGSSSSDDDKSTSEEEVPAEEVPPAEEVAGKKASKKWGASFGVRSKVQGAMTRLLKWAEDRGDVAELGKDEFPTTIKRHPKAGRPVREAKKRGQGRRKTNFMTAVSTKKLERGARKLEEKRHRKEVEDLRAWKKDLQTQRDDVDEKLRGLSKKKRHDAERSSLESKLEDLQKTIDSIEKQLEFKSKRIFDTVGFGGKTSVSKVLSEKASSRLIPFVLGEWRVTLMNLFGVSEETDKASRKTSSTPRADASKTASIDAFMRSEYQREIDSIEPTREEIDMAEESTQNDFDPSVLIMRAIPIINTPGLNDAMVLKFLEDESPTNISPLQIRIRNVLQQHRTQTLASVGQVAAAAKGLLPVREQTRELEYFDDATLKRVRISLMKMGYKGSDVDVLFASGVALPTAFTPEQKVEVTEILLTPLINGLSGDESAQLVEMLEEMEYSTEPENVYRATAEILSGTTLTADVDVTPERRAAVSKLVSRPEGRVALINRVVRNVQPLITSTSRVYREARPATATFVAPEVEAPSGGEAPSDDERRPLADGVTLAKLLAFAVEEELRSRLVPLFNLQLELINAMMSSDIPRDVAMKHAASLVALIRRKIRIDKNGKLSKEIAERVEKIASIVGDAEGVDEVAASALSSVVPPLIPPHILGVPVFKLEDIDKTRTQKRPSSNVVDELYRRFSEGERPTKGEQEKALLDAYKDLFTSEWLNANGPDVPMPKLSDDKLFFRALKRAGDDYNAQLAKAKSKIVEYFSTKPSGASSNEGYSLIKFLELNGYSREFIADVVSTLKLTDVSSTVRSWANVNLPETCNASTEIVDSLPKALELLKNNLPGKIVTKDVVREVAIELEKRKCSKGLLKELGFKAMKNASNALENRITLACAATIIEMRNALRAVAEQRADKMARDRGAVMTFEQFVKKNKKHLEKGFEKFKKTTFAPLPSREGGDRDPTTADPVLTPRYIDLMTQVTDVVNDRLTRGASSNHEVLSRLLLPLIFLTGSKKGVSSAYLRENVKTGRINPIDLIDGLDEELGRNVARLWTEGTAGILTSPTFTEVHESLNEREQPAIPEIFEPTATLNFLWLSPLPEMDSVLKDKISAELEKIAAFSGKLRGVIKEDAMKRKIVKEKLAKYGVMTNFELLTEGREVGVMFNVSAVTKMYDDYIANIINKTKPQRELVYKLIFANIDKTTSEFRQTLRKRLIAEGYPESEVEEYFDHLPPAVPRQSFTDVNVDRAKRVSDVVNTHLEFLVSNVVADFIGNTDIRPIVIPPHFPDPRAYSDIRQVCPVSMQEVSLDNLIICFDEETKKFTCSKASDIAKQIAQGENAVDPATGRPLSEDALQLFMERYADVMKDVEVLQGGDVAKKSPSHPQLGAEAMFRTEDMKWLISEDPSRFNARHVGETMLFAVDAMGVNERELLISGVKKIVKKFKIPMDESNPFFKALRKWRGPDGEKLVVDVEDDDVWVKISTEKSPRKSPTTEVKASKGKKVQKSDASFEKPAPATTKPSAMKGSPQIVLRDITKVTHQDDPPRYFGQVSAIEYILIRSRATSLDEVRRRTSKLLKTNHYKTYVMTVDSTLTSKDVETQIGLSDGAYWIKVGLDPKEVDSLIVNTISEDENGPRETEITEVRFDTEGIESADGTTTGGGLFIKFRLDGEEHTFTMGIDEWQMGEELEIPEKMTTHFITKEILPHIDKDFSGIAWNYVGDFGLDVQKDVNEWKVLPLVKCEKIIVDLLEQFVDQESEQFGGGKSAKDLVHTCAVLNRLYRAYEARF